MPAAPRSRRTKNTTGNNGHGRNNASASAASGDVAFAEPPEASNAPAIIPQPFQSPQPASNPTKPGVTLSSADITAMIQNALSTTMPSSADIAAMIQNALSVPNNTQPRPKSAAVLDERGNPPEVAAAIDALPGIDPFVIEALYKRKFSPERDLWKFIPWNAKNKLDDPKKWSLAFSRFITAMDILYSDSHPHVYRGPLAFHAQIMELAIIYDWNRDVLPLALFCHNRVLMLDRFDEKTWNVTEKQERAWCHRY